MKKQELTKREKYIKKAASWGVQIVIFLVIVYAINLWQTRNLIPSDEKAPQFEIVPLSNITAQEASAQDNSSAGLNDDSMAKKKHNSMNQKERFTLDNLKDKKSILFFFAPWCSVCKANFSFIDSLYESSNGEFNVIAVALSYEAQRDVIEYIQKGGYKMPVYLGNDDMMRRYKINAFPSIYLLNSDLTVSSKMTGFSSNWGIRLRLLMAR